MVDTPTKADPRTAFTPVGVLCFADGLVTARPRNEGGKPDWSCILLFDDAAVNTVAYQNLRAAVMAAIIDKFGQAKAQDPKFVQSLRLPFRNAADKTYEGFDKGKVYISPWKSGEQERPGLVDAFSTKLQPSDIFSGMLARAEVRAFAYDNSGNKGVSFGLNSVQIAKADMPRLDGRRTASEAFQHADNSELAALGIDVAAGPGAASQLDNELPF